jgi:hypothetical protein
MPGRVRGAMDELARMPARCHCHGGAALLIDLASAYRTDRE